MEGLCRYILSTHPFFWILYPFSSLILRDLLLNVLGSIGGLEMLQTHDCDSTPLVIVREQRQVRYQPSILDVNTLKFSLC